MAAGDDCAGAFVGSLFVIKPSFSNAALFPSLIGLLGGLGAGVAYAMVRKLGQIGENKTYIVFFFSAFFLCGDAAVSAACL